MCQNFYSVSPTVKLCVHCDVRFVSIRICLYRIIVTVIDVLNELTAYGESLGLMKMKNLKKFISEQQAMRREERHRERVRTEKVML